MMVEIHGQQGQFKRLLTGGMDDAMEVARGAVANGAYLANILEEGVLTVSVDCTGTTYHTD